MSKDSRAAWRAKEAELQKECDEADRRGDPEDEYLMHESYRRLCDHYDNRSLGDRIGGMVDRFRR